MATIEAEQLKDKKVIAELNNKIAKKTIKVLRVFHGEYLLLSYMPKDFSYLTVSTYDSFISISSTSPYVHAMIDVDRFTRIVLDE